jgi:hypothetical protein
VTRTIQYTDSFKPAKYSEVIEEVFYVDDRKELYVKLHTGVVAGYSNVPDWSYEGFKDAESAGRYWNWDIKGKYGTINGDVNFIPFEKPAAVSAKTGNQSFSVVVQIDGTLKFDIDAEDVGAAVAKVSELVDKTLYDGTYFTKEVKFNK